MLCGAVPASGNSLFFSEAGRNEISNFTDHFPITPPTLFTFRLSTTFSKIIRIVKEKYKGPTQPQQLRKSDRQFNFSFVTYKFFSKELFVNTNKLTIRKTLPSFTKISINFLLTKNLTSDSNFFTLPPLQMKMSQSCFFPYNLPYFAKVYR